MKRTLALCGLLLCMLCVPGRATSAELRTLEAVGSVPVPARESGTSAPRNRAIQSAIEEAVSRAAGELLGEAEAGSAMNPEDIREVLGKDLSQYASSFRVREDRGERPALFAEDPEVATEYVVIVEVRVDIDRVNRRLVESGALASESPKGNAIQVSVEIQGIGDYAQFSALQQLLVDAGGAGARVSPLEIERGKARFGVTSPLDGARLLQRIQEERPEGFSLSTLRAERHSLTLRVDDAPGGAGIGGPGLYESGPRTRSWPTDRSE